MLKVFNLLKSLVVLHVIGIGTESRVLLFSLVHEHLNEDTRHAIEGLQFLANGGLHLALEFFKSLLHVRFCEEGLLQAIIPHIFNGQFHLFVALLLFQVEKGKKSFEKGLVAENLSVTVANA